MDTINLPKKEREGMIGKLAFVANFGNCKQFGMAQKENLSKQNGTESSTPFFKHG